MRAALLTTLPSLVLLLPLVVALGVSGDPARPETTTSALRTVATTTCTELRLVTVDGSTSGTSAALRPLVRELRAQARASGRRVAVSHVGRDFREASRMVPRRLWGRKVSRVVTRSRVRAWQSGTGEAVTRTVDVLRRQAARCPEQHLVLAGFGQGAGVVHRVLRSLGSDATIRPRVVGAALVADPDRRAWTKAELIGHPRAFRGGQGVVSWRLRSPADLPDDGQQMKVVNVCNRADVVCDPRTTTFRTALARYRAYTGPEGVADVTAAARRLARQATLWPIPDPVEKSVAVEVGERFSVQLATKVATGAQDTVVWQDVAGLPSGTSLSRTGLLSGVLDRSGGHRITYRVRNTSPATAATSGAVSLVVRSPGRGGSAGGRTSCEVRGDGTAYCWGENRWGQVGDGTNVQRTSPSKVTGQRRWKQVSTGGSATCGVTESRALYCWGLNQHGQLGLGGGPQRWNPQRVGKGTSWDTVAVGWMHACGTRTDGALFCWGADDHGQVGNGVGADRLSPVRVGRTQKWKRVAVGGWHSCAVTTTNQAWCWGRNDLAQLGTGNLNRQAWPAQVRTSEPMVELDASWSGTCGVTSDGRALCWGMNDQGQIGDGTRFRRAYPTAVAGSHRFSTLAVGDSHACGVDLSGAGWCWGSNRYGQLGDGTRTSRPTPVRVAGDKTWRQVHAGWLHTCAVTSANGSTVCWGNNEEGQLGYGDRTDRVSVPGVTARLAVPRATVATQAVVTSLNILGSSHTEPGGGTRGYAPGRLRSEWAVNLLTSYGSHIAAFQELNLDQRRVLGRSFKGSWRFYPAIKAGQRAVWQTVGWDMAQWDFVRARMIDVPFRGKTRPNPLVELRNKGTGKHVFVFNIHNSAGKTADREAERDRATAIEIAEVKTQRARPVEGLFMGDFNEHDEAFCKVVGRTDLEAVNGGTHVNGVCSPPKYPRIDWMFHSPGFGLLGHEYEKSGRVKRITDHWVLTSRLTVPGA